MSVVINGVVRQKADALSAGIAIVRRILKEHQFPNGFTTKQLYELTQNYSPPPKFKPMKVHHMVVPRPEHPVRSKTFLKTMILPALEGQHEIKTVSQSRSGTHQPPDLSNLRPIRQKQRNALALEFVWKIIPPEERPRAPREDAEKLKRTPFGFEVGVGADTLHLNKRRQMGRVKKVTEAVLKLKEGGLRFSNELTEIVS